MTDNIIDIDGENGREINLQFYSAEVGSIRAIEFKKLKKEIEDKLARNEPVFVKFRDPRRHNSVGRISKVDINYTESNQKSYWSNRHMAHGGMDNIEVTWDGRKNKTNPSTYEIFYLPDWKHTTQWVWEQTVKPKVEAVIAYDHLGQQLEVGQNVCFVHRRYGNVDMKFGTVTRFTDKGTVFVKVMKLKDHQHDAGQELKALSMDDVVIVNDTLMKRLVMAKMAAN